MKSKYGKYIGKVKTEWLDDGRKMRILKDFAFVDPKSIKWVAPAGSIVDGASIPRLFWTLIGGPFEGRYRKASVIHDVACDRKNRSWQSTHLAFYYAMRASQVGIVKAQTMYGAVYFFCRPRWPNPRLKTKRKARYHKRHGMPAIAGAAMQKRELRPSDFNKLKVLIERRGSSAKGPMSLNEIRNYRPSK